MKVKLRSKLILTLSVVFLAVCVALCVSFTVRAGALSQCSSPVLENSIFTQTTPDEKEFILNYDGTAWYQNVDTTFKLYTSDDKVQEAGTVTGIVSDSDPEKYGSLKFVLDAVPDRDTTYYLTAMKEGMAESNTRQVSFVICNIVDALSFSYGDYTDISYFEFYQDQSVYDVVLPTGTASNAAVSISLTVLEGETVNYSGDTNLSNGKATLTASVNSQPYGRSYAYTVNFTTMNLQGSGTEADPWKISTADELMQLAVCHNSGAAFPMDTDTSVGAGNHYGYYFELTNDIDLKGYDWEPIGHSGSTYFSGNFNGNGYTVYNMTSDGLYERYMNGSGVQYDYKHCNTAGLFGWVYMGALKGIIVENASVTAIGDNDCGYAAGLVGIAYYCTVTDCAVYNSTIESGRLPNVNTNAAGAIASFGAGATFERCASVGNTIIHSSYGGGFIGSLADDCSFTDCYAAKCNIIGNSPSVQINTNSGGFIGESQFGLAEMINCFVYDCKAEVAVENTSNSKVGVFTGSRAYDDYSFTNCYYYSSYNEDSEPSYTLNKSGGFWQVRPSYTTYITTNIPDTETLTREDIISRRNEDELIWEFSVDGGETWYQTTLNIAIEKTVKDFSSGSVKWYLNADRDEDVFVASSTHAFPVLASIREYSVSLNKSGVIVSVEKISSEDTAETYEIKYIPSNGVTLSTFEFTVDKEEAGKGATAPELRINSETNEWEVSYNSGQTWTSLGVKATGEAGVQGPQGEAGVQGAEGKAGGSGLAVAATAIGAVAIVGNIAIIAWFFVKRKRV